ncbi:7-carboxy-7-deazaguanine synthase QueE [Thauera sp.]|jgi:7-carboxy-7-deazaguanine synthase|uniref:7-carboxy-7-deazaguanine synthase QueE n=1 Tax=Thauera sp. TaxID=1905334 RepID=UPI002608C8A2|nr:7-carboxy-7-deazaguanine synthase QueE [Thauera sp.]MCK6407920.1 7-carboxy-7-deazaguanine synthase QueE [Thauera sp.]
MTSSIDGTAVAARLRITEIFASLQGESSRVGLPTVFVRLTGCPLRCTWCDTAYAFSGGNTRTLDDILAEVASHGLRHVCVTGGEPLAQKGCLALLSALCEAGYEVSLETSGALDIAEVDARVARIVDLKAPGSGELARNRYENIPLLRAHDELKIVLADAADYDWARQQIAEHRLAERCSVLLSPVAGALEPATLAEWILRDRLPVRFQLQLHKILWNDARGR